MVKGFSMGKYEAKVNDEDTLVFLDCEMYVLNGITEPCQISTILLNKYGILDILDMAVERKSKRHTQHKYYKPKINARAMVAELEVLLSKYPGRKIWVGQSIASDIKLINGVKGIIPTKNNGIDVICDLCSYWNGSLLDNVRRLGTGLSTNTLLKGITETQNEFIPHNALYDCMLGVIAFQEITKELKISSLDTVKHSITLYETIIEVYTETERLLEYRNKRNKSKYNKLITLGLKGQFNRLTSRLKTSLRETKIKAEYTESLKVKLSLYMLGEIEIVDILDYISFCITGFNHSSNPSNYTFSRGGSKDTQKTYAYYDLYKAFSDYTGGNIFSEEAGIVIKKDSDIGTLYVRNETGQTNQLPLGIINLNHQEVNEMETLQPFIDSLEINHTTRDSTYSKLLTDWIATNLSDMARICKINLDLVNKHSTEVIELIKCVVEEDITRQDFLRILLDNTIIYDKEAESSKFGLKLCITDTRKELDYLLTSNHNDLARLVYSINIITDKEPIELDFGKYREKVERVILYGDDYYKVRITNI